VSATCIQPLLDLQRGVISTLPMQDRIDDCAFPPHDEAPLGPYATLTKPLLLNPLREAAVLAFALGSGPGPRYPNTRSRACCALTTNIHGAAPRPPNSRDRP
jgi:hypothetical protein